MRAYRLLTILLLLQSKGRVSAGELAERLEVSRRTVYRDMEALAAAGAPVYAERGPHGGWALLDTGRLEAPTFDDAQLRALQLGGRRDLLDDLGLLEAAGLAWARIEEALGGREGMADRLLVDASSWRGRREEQAALPLIQRGVFLGRRLHLLYDRSGEPVARTVDPLGLVAKGATWYLVAAVDGQPRTYRVSRVLEATLLREPVSRPSDFRLREWWEAQQREFASRLPRVAVVARARDFGLRLLSTPGWYVTIVRQEPEPDGWTALRLSFDAEHLALAWAFVAGEDAELLEPESLRAVLRARAAGVARRYEASS